MTEPKLDEQVSDFMASLFIKHRVYHAEPDPAVVAEWVEFIANQVAKAARLAWNMSAEGWNAEYTGVHRNVEEEIVQEVLDTLNGVKNK